MLIHGAVWGDMRMMLSARGHLVAIFCVCEREGIRGYTSGSACFGFVDVCMNLVSSDL